MRILAALAAAFVLAAPASAEMSKADVEKIVREYLLANPEILNEMIEALQSREESAAMEKAKTGVAANKDALLNDGYSYVGGNPQGDVTVVEFFDYRCGYCRKVRNDVVELLAQDKGVRLVLKELPILSDVSTEAAKAAMAALKQGNDAYWRFHQALLSAEDLDSAAIYDIAAGQGLDVARLRVDMASPEIETQIEANHMLAKALGVDGTPAFIIGEQLVPGAVSAEDLKGIIDQQRGG